MGSDLSSAGFYFFGKNGLPPLLFQGDLEAKRPFSWGEWDVVPVAVTAHLHREDWEKLHSQAEDARGVGWCQRRPSSCPDKSFFFCGWLLHGQVKREPAPSSFLGCHSWLLSLSCSALLPWGFLGAGRGTWLRTWGLWCLLPWIIVLYLSYVKCLFPLFLSAHISSPSALICLILVAFQLSAFCTFCYHLRCSLTENINKSVKWKCHIRLRSWESEVPQHLSGRNQTTWEMGNWSVHPQPLWHFN